MKVLLIRPHISLKVAKRLRAFLHLEPLALEIVAGGIGPCHEVRILDLASEKRPFRLFTSVLESFRPDLTGLTGYSNQAKTVERLAAEAKKILPESMVITGGIHATVAPQYYRHCRDIDLIVRGEGATAMKRLLPLLENGEPLPEDDVFIPVGSPSFQQLSELPPPELPQYSEVPPPRRDLVDRSRYFCIWHGERNEKMPALFPPTAAMRTSVGCPNRCNFCVVHYLAGGKYRQRTPEEVVTEIASIPENHIYFVDDEMFINAKRCERIARLLIERGIEKKYVSWARADTICRHPKLFRLWKEAGLSLLYVGLESMEAKTLDGFNKGIEPDVNRGAVELLRDIGIGLHAAFMVRPEFDDDDFLRLRQAVDYVAPAEVTFTVFSPSPGTPLWEEHRDAFICPDPYAFYDCFHTILPTKLPLKKFYARFAQLYLFSVRNNPWRRNKVKVPKKDLLRFLCGGARYGISLKRIYRDYRDF